MIDHETRQKLAGFGWLTPDDLELIREAPWLAAFIEDGDTEILAAIGRYAEGQKRAVNELHSRGVDAVERHITPQGLLTTSLDTEGSISERSATSVLSERPGEITVEDDGKIIRGLAIPYREHALIAENSRVFLEYFEGESLRKLPKNVPLLQGHDRAVPPAGKILDSHHSPQGMWIEARLSGGASDVDRWRGLFADSLMAGLSVGFREGLGKWTTDARGTPIKLVREAEVIEVSVVNWPAYSSAGVRTVSVRSRADQKRKEESDRAIAEAQEVMARVNARLAARRK